MLDRTIPLLVNHRSHSDILNCSAAVLGKMAAMFPRSLRELRDVSQHVGPRPVYLQPPTSG